MPGRTSRTTQRLAEEVVGELIPLVREVLERRLNAEQKMIRRVVAAPLVLPGDNELVNDVDRARARAILAANGFKPRGRR